MDYVGIMQSLQTKGNVQDLRRSNKSNIECGKEAKGLTNVKSWSLVHLYKLSRDILVRKSPPHASGETSKTRTSSKSMSIKIEKPRIGHNLFCCPETVFQASNSWVNDCGRRVAPNATKNKSSSYLDRIFKKLAIKRRLIIQKSMTVDITEILIYTCNNCEGKIFTATSRLLQTPR